MRRAINNDLEVSGQDSFVDVVTNLVGILIILVVLIGLDTGGKKEEPKLKPERVAELEKLRGAAQQIHSDIQNSAVAIAQVQQTIQQRAAEMQQAAAMISTGEQILKEERAKLDVKSQATYDLQRKLNEAKAAAAEIQREIVATTMAPGQTLEVQARMTPLSKTVFGKEVHFHLRDGRIAYVPIEELFEQARSKTKLDASNINDIQERVEVVGPLGGFELQYTIKLLVDRNRGRISASSNQWQAVTVSDVVGETLEEALRPESEFHHRLSLLPPKDTTVTIWSYGDSFKEFRALRDEVHRLGFAAAGRPLPKGHPIGGSSRGSKSSAQ